MLIRKSIQRYDLEANQIGCLKPFGASKLTKTLPRFNRS